MPADVRIDDVPSVSGDLHVPLGWAWTCDATARGDGRAFAAGDRVVLSFFGVERAGTVVAGGDGDLRNVVRIVGGAGKLPTILEASDYQGRGLDYVVRDVLRSAGEEVGDLSPLRAVTLARWLRPAERADRALHRLMRMAPEGVVLRPNAQGKWDAVRPTWEDLPPAWDQHRVGSWDAEDAAQFLAEAGRLPEPGRAMTFQGRSRRANRVQYVWDEATCRASVWFRPGDATADRFRAAVAKIARDVMLEDGAADFGRLYAGRIAKDSGDDGYVDVFFEDDRNRLRYASGCRVRREVGDTVRWARGTRVLVGWDFGDERFPFALSASWSGGGGLIDLTRKFSGTMTHDGPKHVVRGTALTGDLLTVEGTVLPTKRHLKVKGDEEAEHVFAGGTAPTVATTNPVVTSVSVQQGGDRAFRVRFTTNANQAGGVTLFTVTWGKPWLPAAPMFIGNVDDLGIPLGFQEVVPGVSLLVKLGTVPSPLPSGTYNATIFSCG